MQGEGCQKNPQNLQSSHIISGSSLRTTSFSWPLCEMFPQPLGCYCSHLAAQFNNRNFLLWCQQRCSVTLNIFQVEVIWRDCNESNSIKRDTTQQLWVLQNMCGIHYHSNWSAHIADICAQEIVSEDCIDIQVLNCSFLYTVWVHFKNNPSGGHLNALQFAMHQLGRERYGATAVGYGYICLSFRAKVSQ